VGSKLDPHREQIAGLVREVDGITNTRIRELITEAGYRGSKTILDDYLRELRPPKRTYQRTIYRPGELAQFDLVEPRREIPVGHGQTVHHAEILSLKGDSYRLRDKDLGRRISEGKTKREAMRALKRHISRDLFKRLAGVPLTS
jgi:hypothetical protein